MVRVYRHHPRRSAGPAVVRHWVRREQVANADGVEYREVGVRAAVRVPPDLYTAQYNRAPDSRLRRPSRCSQVVSKVKWIITELQKLVVVVLLLSLLFSVM